MDTDSVQTTTVSEDPVTGTTAKRTTTITRTSLQDFFVSKTNQVIFAIVAIIDLLILLRFVFLLLGANQVGFVTLIMNLTEIFVAPAKGIFPSTSVPGGYFEVASIVAIVMWLIFAYIVSLIISLFSSHTEE